MSADGRLFVHHRWSKVTTDDIWLSQRARPGAPWQAPVRLRPEINTQFRETIPTLSADGLTLIFGSNRPKNPDGQTVGDMDLWMSTRANRNAKWTPAEHLGPIVNSPQWEEYPVLSADGLQLYLLSQRHGGANHAEIWMASRPSTSAPFDQIVNLGPVVNTARNQEPLALSADGKTLYVEARNEDNWNDCQLISLTRLDEQRD